MKNIYKWTYCMLKRIKNVHFSSFLAIFCEFSRATLVLSFPSIWLIIFFHSYIIIISPDQFEPRSTLKLLVTWPLKLDPSWRLCLIDPLPFINFNLFIGSRSSCSFMVKCCCSKPDIKTFPLLDTLLLSLGSTKKCGGRWSSIIATRNTINCIINAEYNCSL